MTEHPNLAAALVAALASLTTIDTDRSANMGTYSYKYADLGDIVKETRPVLAEHGVAALTPLGAHDDELGVTVIFLHTSGERMDFGPFPFPHGRDAQATGSMVTYHRRYALLAALGMATGDDDDGAAAVAGPARGRARNQSAPADAGFLTLFNDLPSEKQKQTMAWLREHGAKPNAVPADLLDDAKAFVASLEDDPTRPFDDKPSAADRAAAMATRTSPLNGDGKSESAKAGA